MPTAQPNDNRPVTTTIHANGKPILVHGAHLVSEKLLAVIMMLVEFVAGDGPSGVSSIIFRNDDMPTDVAWEPDSENEHDEKAVLKRVFGNCCVEHRSIAINLRKLFEATIDATLEMKNQSALAIWWQNIIVTLAHEIHHVHRFASLEKKEAWDHLLQLKADARSEEDEVDKLAHVTLFTLAKAIDLEPPFWGEEKHFAEEIVTLYAGEDGAEDEQLQWLEDRVMIMMGEGDEAEPCTSFRTYLQMQVQEEDAEWVVPEGGLVDIMAAFTATKGVQSPQAATMGVQADYVEGPMDPAYDPDQPEGTHAVEGMDPTAVFAGGMAAAPAEVPSIPTAAPPAATPPPVAPVYAPPAEAAPVATFGPGGAAPVYAPATAPAVAQAPAATAGVQAGGQAVANVLPDLGMDFEHMKQVVLNVFEKIHNHVFTNCQAVNLAEMDPMVDADGFVNVDACWDKPIMLTEEERAVVPFYMGMNAQGQWSPNNSTADGQLRGFVASQKKIPMYKLVINANGQKMVRMVMVSNPNKRNYDGSLSKNAVLSRAGNAITFVFEGDDAVKAAKPDAGLKWKKLNAEPWQPINV